MAYKKHYINNISTSCNFSTKGENGRLISSLSRKAIGDYAERVIEFYLKSKGHTILYRNLRLKVGEIDILSRFMGSYYIVEVKAALLCIRKSANGKYFYGPGYKRGILPEENLSRTKILKLRKLRSELLMNGMVEGGPVSILGFAVDLYYSIELSDFIKIKIRCFPYLY